MGYLPEATSVQGTHLLFDLLWAVDLIRHSRDWRLWQPTVCTRYEMPFVFTNAAPGVSAERQLETSPTRLILILARPSSSASGGRCRWRSLFFSARS